MGIVIEKEWISTDDERTRESHVEMDGVRVKYDEEFPNGLMYPADPNGDPSEVYNCRCTMRAILPKYNGEARTEHTKETYEEWLTRKRAEQMERTHADITAEALENIEDRLDAIYNADESIPERNDVDWFGIEKPTRPHREDFEDEQQYITARDEYRRQREEYEQLKKEWIEEHMPHPMGAKEFSEWVARNDILIYNDMTDIDMRAMSDFTQRYDSLIREFPIVKEMAKDWYYDGKVNLAYNPNESYLIEATGGFNFGRMFNDYSSVLNDVIDQITDKDLVLGAGPPNNLYDHEFGHNLMTAIRWSITNEDDKMRFNDDVRNSLFGKEGCSTYSNTNELEVFAEGFSAWHGGMNTEFANSFGELLGRWLK